MDASDRVLIVLFGCFVPLLPWILIVLIDWEREFMADVAEAIGWAIAFALIDWRD